MIVQCHVCAVRYLLSDNMLGSKGCHVRCATCGNIWHQSAAPSSPYTLIKKPESKLALRETKHSHFFWAGVISLILLAAGAVTIAWGRHYFIGVFPKTRDFYTLLGAQSPSDALEITSFSFKREPQNTRVLFQGVLRNTSQNVIKAPTLILFFAMPHKERTWEKVQHAMPHLTILPGKVHSFSFSLSQIPPHFSFVSAVFAP